MLSTSHREGARSCVRRRPPLLVASDGRPSTSSWPMRIPDKGRASRTSPGSGSLLADSRPPYVGIRRRARSMECRGWRCCRSSAWGAAIRGVGLEGIPTGATSHHALEGRASRSAADLHAGHEGTDWRRRRTSAARGVRAVGAERLAEVERVVVSYEGGRGVRARRGIIIADTKFELGLDPDGNLVLADEALTPDALSRFWPADSYNWAVAGQLRQAVRAGLRPNDGADKTDPGPDARTLRRRDAREVRRGLRATTGVPFDHYLDDPSLSCGRARPMRATVVRSDEGRILDPQGAPSSRRSRTSVSPWPTRASGRWSTWSSTPPTSTTHAPWSGCASSCSRTR